MPGFTSYSVDNDKRFQKALVEAQRQVGDLTIPLTLISKDFYKSEQSIWDLKSPGQYPDLAPSTKKDRQRRGQSLYPILRRSGALERSMTNPTDQNAINTILGGNALVIGTKVRSERGYLYPAVHQFGSVTVPTRKFLFIGPEAPQFATSEQAGRLERWMGILEGYVTQKLAQLGTVRKAG